MQRCADMRILRAVYPRVCGVDERRRQSPTAEPVYPRVCGVDALQDPNSAPDIGLSPRVRGRLFDLIPDGVSVGFIPACAG